MLNYKKKKKTIKGIKQIGFGIFFAFFLFLPASILQWPNRHLKGTWFRPDLDTFNRCTKAEKKVDKLRGFLQRMKYKWTTLLIGTILWLKSLRDGFWKCHIRLTVQKEWRERDRSCSVGEREKQRGGRWMEK